MSSTSRCGSAPAWPPRAASARRRWTAGSRRWPCSSASAPPAESPAEDVHVFATSAIRDAANRDEFLRRGRGARPGTRSRSSRPRTRRTTDMWPRSTPRRSTDGVVLDIGGGSMQLIQVDDRRAHRAVLVPARRGADDREVPVRGSGPARKKDLQRAARPRARRARRPGLADGRGRAAGRHRAARCATWPRPAQRVTGGGIDLGVQGFVLTAETLDELVADAGRAAGRRARHGPGDQARPRRHHPGRGW